MITHGTNQIQDSISRVLTVKTSHSQVSSAHLLTHTSHSVDQSYSEMSSSPINASVLLENTATTENLLDFVGNFGSAPNRDQPNTSAPQSNTPVPIVVEMAPVNPSRSRPLLRYNRLHVVSNQTRRNRQGPPRTPLQSLAGFLEKCRRRRLAIRARQQKKPLGVCAVKPKPFVSQDKKEIVGLPSLFDVGLLAELTDEDEFLGPMKRAILDNDV